MQTPETAKLVILSTSHVSKPTADYLDKTAADTWPFVGDQRIPDDLFAVMTWARQHKASYILSDRDAGRIDDLPVFDW